MNQARFAIANHDYKEDEDDDDEEEEEEGGTSDAVPRQEHYSQTQSPTFDIQPQSTSSQAIVLPPMIVSDQLDAEQYAASYYNNSPTLASSLPPTPSSIFSNAPSVPSNENHQCQTSASTRSSPKTPSAYPYVSGKNIPTSIQHEKSKGRGRSEGKVSPQIIRTTKKKKRTETFALYIYKVLKQVHPGNYCIDSDSDSVCALVTIP